MGSRTLLAVLLTLTVEACSESKAERHGDGTSGTGGAALAELGERCDESTLCANGLYCAVGGELEGTCTAECESSSVCKARFGDNSACSGDLCYRTCRVVPAPAFSPIPGAPPQQTANSFECSTQRCRIVGDYGLCYSGL